jgi:hypothetical protein
MDDLVLRDLEKKKKLRLVSTHVVDTCELTRTKAGCVGLIGLSLLTD